MKRKRMKYKKRAIEELKQEIKKENNKRKMEHKSLTYADLEDFWIKVEEKKEELRKKKEIKNKKELEKLEFAKSFKPSYISQYTDMFEEENLKIKEQELIKKDEIEALIKKKNKFGDKVRRVNQPSINEKLKKKKKMKYLIY